MKTVAWISLWVHILVMSAFAVTATRGPVLRGDEALDPNGIRLENEYLKVGIVTIGLAGQVKSFVYKPTGHEMAGQEVPFQGLCTDRMGEDRWFWRHACPTEPKKRHNFCPEGYRSEIIESGEDRAVAEVGYTWFYAHNDVETTIEISKRYTLERGSAALRVDWTLRNTGEVAAGMTPWVKNCGRQNAEEELLRGPTIVMREQGPAPIRHEEQIDPLANWAVRLSGLEDNASKPMFGALYPYENILKHFEWVRGERFKNETIFRRITLAPGEHWTMHYVVNAMPNLGNVAYLSPELAAGVDVYDPDRRAGEEVRVAVTLAPAMSLGARRLEGVVRPPDGGAEITLPNREVVLEAGKIAEVPYTFTPPDEGVYEIILTVYERQKIQRLGKDVNSQRSSITLPVVVGPMPETVVQAWESGGTAWSPREERTIAPWRTLVRSDRLRAGQIRVPGRLYPEDRLLYAETTEPAYIRLAAGQHESLQFAVEVPEGIDVMDLALEVGLLRGGAGQALEALRLYEVMYLNTETPSGYRAYPVGAWPDPLFPLDWAEKIPNAPVALRNLEIQRTTGRRVFWATVETSRDATPGLYRGDIVLTLAGEEAGRFPLRVRVSDFVLPLRPSYRPSTGLVGFKGSRASNWEIMGLSPEKVSEIRKTAMDQYRAIILEYGWTPTMWWGLKDWKQWGDYGRGATSFSTSAERDSETDRWLKENGLLKYAFTYAPFDEHTDAKVPEVVEWAKGFREKSDIPIGDCYYGGNVDPLIEWVDLWMGQNPRSAHWGEPTGPLGWGHKALQAKQERGVDFVAVNSSLIWYIEFDPIGGRAAFWDDFVTGLDGRYVYSTCRWTDDVYERNWTSGNYMGCAVYPGPDGMTPSIRMETLRDGVYDYDTLALLRKVVAEARESERSEALAGSLAEAEAIVTDRSLSSRVGSVEDLHVLREKIADLIETLQP